MERSGTKVERKVRYLFTGDTMSLIDDAIREHARLTQEIGEKDALIAELRKPARIAREAIDRFCDSSLLDVAEKWLNSKSI